MSDVQENMELVATNDNALVDFDLSELSQELGTPFSDQDILKNSAFLTERPALMKAIMSMPNHSKAKMICQYIDNANYSMAGDDRFKAMPAKIVKKMDPSMPLFRPGSFRLGDHPTPSESFKFFPLFLYRTRVYFPPYEGESQRAICSSTNNTQGVCQQPSPYIRECGPCPFKEWGVSDDGSIDPTSHSKPLCRPVVYVVGVTPEFDGLYELTLNTYCLISKSFNAPSNCITAGRMNSRFEINPHKLGIDPKDLGNFMVNFSTLDQSSTWLDISGQPVEQNKKIVSAGTVVSNSREYLTKEQAIYVMMYRQMAENYYYYIMNNFVNYMDKTVEKMKEQSVSDTVSVDSVVVEDIDDADIMDSIDVDD